MSRLLKIEELALFGLAVYLFSLLDISGWWYAVLFLSPDLSMLGYLHNSRTGAFSYNLAHHKGTAVALYLLGLLIVAPWVQFVGLLLLGHSSFDRVFGYGLKYADAFQHTHLGMVGKQ
ncbi:MAG: DUF4260 domain-containing protein [Chloroflexota bacterium]